MSDIPEDIAATARTVFASIATVDWVEAEIIIARAILAERERCAEIAEDMGRKASRDREIAALGIAGVGQVMAHAIRRGYVRTDPAISTPHLLPPLPTQAVDRTGNPSLPSGPITGDA